MIRANLKDKPRDIFSEPIQPRWIPPEMLHPPVLDHSAPRGRLKLNYALLINPFYPKDPNASFGKHVLTPTQALTSFAATTPTSWEVRYWDENLLHGRPPGGEPGDVIPEVVGISVHLTFAQRAFELARWYRERGSKIVMGGLHVLSCPEECAPHADALAMGDGVQLWGLILRDVETEKLSTRRRGDTEKDEEGGKDNTNTGNQDLEPQRTQRTRRKSLVTLEPKPIHREGTQREDEEGWRDGWGNGSKDCFSFLVSRSSKEQNQHLEPRRTQRPQGEAGEESEPLDREGREGTPREDEEGKRQNLEPQRTQSTQRRRVSVDRSSFFVIRNAKEEAKAPEGAEFMHGARVYRATYENDYADDPAPRREILPRNSFLTTTSLIATRGCHNRCGFCYLSTEGLRMPYRMRRVEQVVEEFAADSQPYAVFVDNNLGSKREYLRSLCQALRPLNKIWSAAVSIDVTDDPSLVREMALGGCTGVFVGFESLTDQNLTDARKKTPKTADYARRVRLLHDYGIQVNGSFVLGFDHDDKQVFARTADWIEENRLECATFHILTPYPATPLYRQMEAEGRLLHRDWTRYDTSHCVFRPKQMSAEELEHGYAWIYQRLFSNASIWRRRPEDWRAVAPYMAMSYLYKKSNRLWHQLIKRDMVRAVWRPLVEVTRWRHVRFRRALELAPEGSSLLVARSWGEATARAEASVPGFPGEARPKAKMSGQVVSAGV